MERASGVNLRDLLAVQGSLSPERAAATELELLVTVTGLDDTTGQTTHGIKTYEPGQLRVGHRLVDIAKFHEIEPDGG